MFLLNLLTNKINDQSAVTIPARGAVEERLPGWRARLAESGGKAAGVGVGVAEVEYGRKITRSGSKC